MSCDHGLLEDGVDETAVLFTAFFAEALSKVVTLSSTCAPTFFGRDLEIEGHWILFDVVRCGSFDRKVKRFETAA